MNQFVVTIMERPIILLNLILSIFSVASCFVISIIQFSIYENNIAGCWAAFAGCLGGVSFHLHVLSYFRKLEKCHSVRTLEAIDHWGLLTCLFGFGFTCWYLNYIVSSKEGFEEHVNLITGSAACSFIFMILGLYTKISAKIYIAILKSQTLPFIACEGDDLVNESN